MRISGKKDKPYEADMTPMIDMTFQLIAFFMIVINFSDSEQHRSVVLPKAQLAKPRDKDLDPPLVIHVTRQGRATFKGQEYDIAEMKSVLRNFAALREDATEKTVVIRGDKDVATGKIQRLIEACQENGFEKFALRAKQEIVQ